MLLPEAGVLHQHLAFRHTKRVIDYVECLRLHAQDGQIAGVIHTPGRLGEQCAWPQGIDQRIIERASARGISQPWKHQGEAMGTALAGYHTVLATGTGSGKSLAAWAPALSAVLAGRIDVSGGRDAAAGARPKVSLRNVGVAANVLYLAPTKALAADQYVHVEELLGPYFSLTPTAVVDGDTGANERAWARQNARVVLSNPDFLNHVMLAGHPRWERFLKGLAYVIIDEFHSYRGLFGAHVALLMRRLRRVCAHYGAHPRFIFLSATSGDPAGVATRFIGVGADEVRAITEDSSPAGDRTVILWRCRKLDEDQGGQESHGSHRSEVNDDDEPATAPLTADAATPLRRAPNTEAGELSALLVDAGARILTFVRSRAGVEKVAEITTSRLEDMHSAASFSSYRGGYLPEERRELEAALRDGTLGGLATTNALELGIDISGLDAVIVTGWPGTYASFFQQIGRAGRSGAPGLAVFIARDNPLDHYLLDHQAVLEDADSEVNVFDPANPHILLSHLCAAAAEVPLTQADCALFGLDSTELFSALEAEGMLRARPRGWFFNFDLVPSPHSLIELRGEAMSVAIVEEATGSLLGTVSAGQADSQVYPGAIYVHRGRVMEILSNDGQMALAQDYTGQDIRTFASEHTTVSILSVDESRGRLHRGMVDVSSQVTSYDIRRNKDGSYLGTRTLDLPERHLETQACWWVYSASELRRWGISSSDLPGALHAAEHACISMLPLLATCDRWDLGGLSTAFHPETGEATIFVHDAASGGAGFSYRGFEDFRHWVALTLDMLRSCPCERGCPRCVQSPKCGNNNEPLSKAGAIAVLTGVLNEREGA